MTDKEREDFESRLTKKMAEANSFWKRRSLATGQPESAFIIPMAILAAYEVVKEDMERTDEEV